MVRRFAQWKQSVIDTLSSWLRKIKHWLWRNYLHFTASEISADDITAPISPHRTSPPAKFTAFALHRRQITPLCKSPPWRILRLATHRRTVKCARITPSGLAWYNRLYPQLVMGATNTTRTGCAHFGPDWPLLFIVHEIWSVRRRARADAASVKTTCPVCLTVNCDVAIVPCGHCVCSACMQNITSAAVGSSRCPVCRADINTVLRLHFAA